MAFQLMVSVAEKEVLMMSSGYEVKVSTEHEVETLLEKRASTGYEVEALLERTVSCVWQLYRLGRSK